MNKNELQYQETLSFERKFIKVVELIKQVTVSATTLGSIYLIFEGMTTVLSGKDASTLSAIATIVEAGNLGSFIGLTWGASMTFAWSRERTGKKRAIREKATFQLRAEGGDADRRSSSGLTETGGTPKG